MGKEDEPRFFSSKKTEKQRQSAATHNFKGTRTKHKEDKPQQRSDQLAESLQMGEHQLSGSWETKWTGAALLHLLDQLDLGARTSLE